MVANEQCMHEAPQSRRLFHVDGKFFAATGTNHPALHIFSAANDTNIFNPDGHTNVKDQQARPSYFEPFHERIHLYMIWLNYKKEFYQRTHQQQSFSLRRNEHDEEKRKRGKRRRSFCVVGMMGGSYGAGFRAWNTPHVFSRLLLPFFFFFSRLFFGILEIARTSNN